MITNALAPVRTEGKGVCLSCNRHQKLNYRVRGNICLPCSRKKSLSKKERKARRREAKEYSEQYFNECVRALRSLNRRESKPAETPRNPVVSRIVERPQHVVRRIEPPRPSSNELPARVRQVQNGRSVRTTGENRGEPLALGISAKNASATERVFENKPRVLGNNERVELKSGDKKKRVLEPRLKPTSSFSLLEQASGTTSVSLAKTNLHGGPKPSNASGQSTRNTAAKAVASPTQNAEDSEAGARDRPKAIRSARSSSPTTQKRGDHVTTDASLTTEQTDGNSQESEEVKAPGMEGIARQASNLLESVTRGSSFEGRESALAAKNSETPRPSNGVEGSPGSKEPKVTGRVPGGEGKVAERTTPVDPAQRTNAQGVVTQRKVEGSVKGFANPAAAPRGVQKSVTKAPCERVGGSSPTSVDITASRSTQVSEKAVKAKILSSRARFESSQERGSPALTAGWDEVVPDGKRNECRAGVHDTLGEEAKEREDEIDVTEKDQQGTEMKQKAIIPQTEAIRKNDNANGSVQSTHPKSSNGQSDAKGGQINGGAEPLRLKRDARKSVSPNDAKRLEALEVTRLRLLARINKAQREKRKLANASSVRPSSKPKVAGGVALPPVASPAVNKQIETAPSSSEPPQQLSVMSQDLKLTFNMNEEIQKKKDNRGPNDSAATRNGASTNSVEGTIAILKGRIASREKKRIVSTLESTLEKMKGAKKAELGVKRLEVKVRQQLIKVNAIRGRILEHENASHQKEVLASSHIPHNA